MDKVKNHIVNWLREYCQNSGQKGYVIGVSGGVDSAVTSTLCAETGLPIIVLTMPIHQAQDQNSRGVSHCLWLKNRYPNVTYRDVPLSRVYDEFVWWITNSVAENKLAMANSKSRLRMVALYAFAGANKMLVAGTGNKVEDFGVGFYTKGGDGVVDVSPIADLTKTQVWDLAKHLRIHKDIIEATPTDGLWDNNQSDEDQLGASYPELEQAMLHYEMIEQNNIPIMTVRELEVLEIFKKFNKQNKHKMLPIPVCKIPDNI